MRFHGRPSEVGARGQRALTTYRYDPYGRVTITRNGQPQTTDPLGQHWGVTGRFLDEESGLYYYRARYYDAGLGRFLQRDPLGLAANPSLYEYVNSNPLGDRDPTGLDPKRDDLLKRLTENIELLEQMEEVAASAESFLLAEIRADEQVIEVERARVRGSGARGASASGPISVEELPASHIILVAEDSIRRYRERADRWRARKMYCRRQRERLWSTLLEVRLEQLSEMIAGTRDD